MLQTLITYFQASLFCYIRIFKLRVLFSQFLQFRLCVSDLCCHTKYRSILDVLLCKLPLHGVTTLITQTRILASQLNHINNHYLGGRMSHPAQATTSKLETVTH